eukprot:gnl/MRDRNA2_/MRDRNA2_133509_c0_seq1.p1 gnl/MRDRNA2_/MRDRNA2_133509_c0~~gnl/MRDRNA2_/MRDRNA2_133509_c0_seq1.p1  ORF type:complete len:299 (-),score=51.84 gnl/MRDRNA2_/MRDRNA2_133509_c0_seq1:100-996(-)
MNAGMRWKLASCCGCTCFSLVVIAVVLLIIFPVGHYATTKERWEQGIGGRCQVYDSSKNSSLYYTAAAASTPVAERCNNLQQCTPDKKKPWFADWEKLLVDGDHGLKVRWPSVDSTQPVSSKSVDETLLGAAVECPCLEPPAEILGEGGGKPHADGSALIVPKLNDPLWNFTWPKESDGCTLVHWFRGGREGTTQTGISSKIIGPKSHDHMSLNDWVEAGELDCVAIPAHGEWTKDELLVNVNKDGAIEAMEKFGRAGNIAVIVAAIVIVMGLVASLGCCFLARRWKPASSGHPSPPQ